MDFDKFIGETTEYDKKQAVEHKQVKNWLKSVSAFANTIGGTLIFGIMDDDTVVGLDDIKADSEFISQKVKERISPFPDIKLEIQKADNGKNILLLHVYEGSETPYYYIGDGRMEAYIRVGNESVSASSTDLKRLVLRGRNSTYDVLSSPYQYEDYAFSKLKERYKLWTGHSLTEKNLESFLLKNNNGFLTNAGALLADESPIYCSRLFCTRWNGLDKNNGKFDALDSAEYKGSLIVLLNEGMSFAKRHMNTLWKKTSDSRIEMPDYCERSIFEALVNALIHRDYLINGSEVHIDIYDDRLSIYSPGGMPDGTFIQERDLSNIPSTRRNPILADVFEHLGYMERQGSGLGKIRNAYRQAPNYTIEKEPSFRSNRVEFTVTLPNLNYHRNSKYVLQHENDVNDVLDDVLDDELTANQKKIMQIIANYPKDTQKKIAEKTKLSISTVQRVMQELQKLEKIERHGSKRNGQWHIKE